MRHFTILLVHLLATVFRLARPGGVRAVVAESLLVKHQLLIANRSRRRAPNLRVLDRLIAGLCSLWIKPKRRCRLAIVKAVDISQFSSRHGATQVSVAVFTKAANEAGAEGADCGFDPSRRRDEAAQSVVGMSADGEQINLAFGTSINNIY